MNILSFDIEEWFHLLDNDSTRTEKQWCNFESRIHRNMDIIHEILDTANVDATFFVVGWIAQKYPEIVRRIANLGFEIGSHTHYHQLSYELDRKTFYTDVERSIKTIEDCTGKKVSSFRAPGFSITERNLWAFEVLYELGISTDSSVFPASRAHGGFASYSTHKPSLLNYNGVTIKEFPINTHTFLGKSIIFSGGGYFRLYPYNLIRAWSKKSDYIMSYFHPRDFDYSHPRIEGLSRIRRFKTNVGLHYSKEKLLKWLSDFKFIDMTTAELSIKWSEMKNIYL
jgi:polysaccharide deacetylase family protein (PEP-CTERM system associated)